MTTVSVDSPQGFLFCAFERIRMLQHGGGSLWHPVLGRTSSSGPSSSHEGVGLVGRPSCDDSPHRDGGGLLLLLDTNDDATKLTAARPSSPTREPTLSRGLLSSVPLASARTAAAFFHTSTLPPSDGDDDAAAGDADVPVSQLASAFWLDQLKQYFDAGLGETGVAGVAHDDALVMMPDDMAPLVSSFAGEPVDDRQPSDIAIDESCAAQRTPRDPDATSRSGSVQEEDDLDVAPQHQQTAAAPLEQATHDQLAARMDETSWLPGAPCSVHSLLSSGTKAQWQAGPSRALSVDAVFSLRYAAKAMTPEDQLRQKGVINAPLSTGVPSAAPSASGVTTTIVSSASASTSSLNPRKQIGTSHANHSAIVGAVLNTFVCPKTREMFFSVVLPDCLLRPTTTTTHESMARKSVRDCSEGLRRFARNRSPSRDSSSDSHPAADLAHGQCCVDLNSLETLDALVTGWRRVRHSQSGKPDAVAVSDAAVDALRRRLAEHPATTVVFLSTAVMKRYLRQVLIDYLLSQAVFVDGRVS